jgi:glycosyltransferase involved in cell wall biosynthesis
MNVKRYNIEGKKKRIIFIGSLPPPYHGANISNEKILKSKIMDIFDLYHIDISDHRDLNNLGRIDFINLYIGFKNFIYLFFLLLKVKPDIVLFNIAQNIAYLRDGMFILISRFFSKSKIVIYLRNSYFKHFYEKGNWFIKKFIDFTLPRVDTAIILGNSLKIILDKWIKNFKVVPNGTDFNPDISVKNFKKNDKKLVVSYLGNLYEWKGVMDFLEAAKIVLYKQNNIKFKIAGFWTDEYFKNKVFNFIERDDLNSNVELSRPVLGKEKEEFLLNTDIFVFPSWSEGHPNVILEAMAAACPVISTKSVGAIPETVIDGETGILVKKKTPKEIADAIIYLMKNPNKRMEMAIAGRKRFEENYTMEKNIDNLIEAFNSILKNKIAG